MAVKHADQACKQVGLLLVHGRQVRADGEERIGAVPGSEATRYLLLYLGHTQRLLGQVVGEWHAPLTHETPHIQAMITQAFEQVGRLGLLESPS